MKMNIGEEWMKEKHIDCSLNNCREADMKAELLEIVRLAKLSGRWTQFFDGIEWDHPKLICWQRDAQTVDDKLEQLINDFLDNYK